jgi:RHS repeat-associated protein
VSRRFTGQILDAETGLYYYNARYYDPELGRFIQADTKIPDLSNPQSYNRYSYCLNNPLRYTDPDGHGFWSTVGSFFNAETYKSSGQLMVMHDSFGWRCVEIPVAVGGMAIATADNVLNVVSLGGKGALEGGAKELAKVGEKLVEGEGEKVGAKVLKGAAVDEAKASRGWKVGDPINNLTREGNVPSWSAVRERFWKNEALNNPGNYSPENLDRMRKGLAPQRVNDVSGKLESMELHHDPPQRSGGLFDVKPVWPNEHAELDPFRHTGK